MLSRLTLSDLPFTNQSPAAPTTATTAAPAVSPAAAATTAAPADAAPAAATTAAPADAAPAAATAAVTAAAPAAATAAVPSGTAPTAATTAAPTAATLPSLIPQDEFPVLQRRLGARGERLVYLDSAASALVPNRVIAAVEAYLHTSCSNIHRGAHQLAEESTNLYETVRERTAAFCGLAAPHRLLYTHGATESLNLAARCWAAACLRAGDLVVCAVDNHHANIVPWQLLAKERGLRLEWLMLDDDGFLDYAAWCRLAEQKPRLVALSSLSNVLGYAQPQLGAIMADARRAGAVVVLDAAQSVGHEPLALAAKQGREGDPAVPSAVLSATPSATPSAALSATPLTPLVQQADFLAFSTHKMMGLTGLGALLCGEEVLRQMTPVFGGGGMVERVTLDGFCAHKAPQGFEPGTPAIAAVAALGEAITLIEEYGLPAVERHTQALSTLLLEGLRALPEIYILGNPQATRTTLVSFTVQDVHPHDVSHALSQKGIAVRAGHHCAMPLHQALGYKASVRASVAAYSSEADVRAFLEAVQGVAETKLGKV